MKSQGACERHRKYRTERELVLGNEERERTSKTETASVEPKKAEHLEAMAIAAAAFFSTPLQRSTQKGRGHEEKGHHEFFVPVANGENSQVLQTPVHTMK